MDKPEILKRIDSLRDQNISFAKITKTLKKEGVKIGITKVWYLATFGSRVSDRMICMGPNCTKEIRKITNSKYCSTDCFKKAKAKREKERRIEFMEVAN